MTFDPLGYGCTRTMSPSFRQTFVVSRLASGERGVASGVVGSCRDKWRRGQSSVARLLAENARQQAELLELRRKLAVYNEFCVCFDECC